VDFDHFWRTYLYNGTKRESVGIPLYELVRNGLAHVYVAKGAIHVTKDRPALHLVRDTNGAMCIDAGQLVDDLERAYDQFKPTKTSPRWSDIAARLDEMEKAYLSQAQKHDQALSCLDAPTGSASGSPVPSMSAFSGQPLVIPPGTLSTSGIK
jgi:hypothetical protein